MADTATSSFARRHFVLTGLVVLLGVLLIAAGVVLPNPQWVRAPLERFVSAQLHRELKLGDLRFSWNGQPTLVLTDVVLGNLPGGSEPQMARIRSMEMTLSLPNLLRGHIVIPKVGMGDID